MAESFFHNLNGFNNGVVLSDQNKFDFLSYENKKIFEFSSFIGLGMYGFKKYTKNTIIRHAPVLNLI